MFSDEPERRQYLRFAHSLHEIAAQMDATARAAGVATRYERRLPSVAGDAPVRLLRTSFAEALTTVMTQAEARHARITAISVKSVDSAARIIATARWADESSPNLRDQSYFAAVRGVFESEETRIAASKLIDFLCVAIQAEPASIASVSGGFYTRSNFEINKADEFAKQLIGLVGNFLAADPVKDGASWKITTTQHFVPSQLEVIIEASTIEIRLF